MENLKSCSTCRFQRISDRQIETTNGETVSVLDAADRPVITDTLRSIRSVRSVVTVKTY